MQEACWADVSAAAGSTRSHCKICLLPWCCRTQTCRFSGLKIYPGKGIFFVRTDGQVSLWPFCSSLESSMSQMLTALERCHGVQQAACDRQSALQGAIPTSSLILSAELPVPEQENKAVVSPAEEACKDCMDSHIQEAASQGQPRWLHAWRSLQRSGHLQAELPPGCWLGWRLGKCALQALLSAGADRCPLFCCHYLLAAADVC